MQPNFKIKDWVNDLQKKGKLFFSLEEAGEFESLEKGKRVRGWNISWMSGYGQQAWGQFLEISLVVMMDCSIR